MSRLLSFEGALFAIALVVACRGSESSESRRDPSPARPTAAASSAAPPSDRFSEEGLLAEGARYLDDPDFRRTTLVECLTNPTNTYSRQRLDSYGLKTKGWDLLPEWNPQSIPVTSAMAASVRAGRTPVVEPSMPRLWDGKRPVTMAGWVALGREVFFGYPLRVEIFMSYALAHPDIGERVGVRAGDDGVYPGVRAFVDLHGKTALGITCAICHSNVTHDPTSARPRRVVVGEARRAFDYGALRLSYHRATKVPVDPDLARRMKTWGPGRADVTEDDDEDPVAIPDLWGLRHQTLLTQAGTIKHVGSTALAIRQETQLLHSNHQKIRPPRELAFALTMFLYSLEPPRDPAGGALPASSRKMTVRGETLFEEHCRSCHSNRALGGPAIPVDRIGTDRALAMGGARGTGKYRPPALLRVSAAAPYFHHGAVPTLDDVLSPDRFEESYTRSPVAKGPVPGHRYGIDLPREDRDALVAFLRSL